MRVLYLIDSLSGGGAEQSLAALAPHYPQRGVDLEVAYLRERPGLHGAFETAGVRLHSLNAREGRLDKVLGMRRLLRELRPDVLHTTLFDSDVIGRMAGAGSRLTVVTSLVNVAYSDTQLEDPRLRRWKVRAAQIVDAATAQLVSRFHAITDHVAGEMCRRLMIPRDRVDVVPRGRDPDRLGVRTEERRTAARTGLGVDDGMPVLLVAARQEFQKGLDVLLEALPRVLDEIPRARVLLAGREGNETVSLRAGVERLGLGGVVTFLGTRKDVPELMCAADAFVFPSRWEGLGSVLIEAMALEVPIVASDLPPIREVVDGGNGALLVPPGHPEALSGALLRSIQDRAGAGERVRRSRDRFLDLYTIGRVADAMVEFYGRALSTRRLRA